MGFNEGGADCPPKAEYLRWCFARLRRASMKGGRTAPRKCCKDLLSMWLVLASMKGGRTAPRKLHHALGFTPAPSASMKGGRTAPRKRTETIPKTDPPELQ